MGLQVPEEAGFLHPDFMELAAYLGPEFRLDWCNASDQKGHDDAARYGDNEKFVRETTVFMYQNIALMIHGIHRPYIAKIVEIASDKGGVSFLEVAAAGGQLGLALHTLGFQVSFADIYSRSLRWLLWRLHNRNLALPVYMLDDGWSRIPYHQLASAFDVIEHLSPPEQRELIENLASVAGTVFVNLIVGDGSGDMEGVHFSVDPDDLTAYCESRWPTAYFDYYPDAAGKARQRLLIYGERLKISDE